MHTLRILLYPLKPQLQFRLQRSDRNFGFASCLPAAREPSAGDTHAWGYKATPPVSKTFLPHFQAWPTGQNNLSKKS